MQIYALDEKGTLLQAGEGSKQETYRCPDCSSLLRIRGGQWRRLHFYHLRPTPSCPSNGKSLTHLQIQYAIQKWLAPEEVLLECRFPEINRIADVVWPDKKMIFEIQCSPISKEEVEARCLDYNKMGYLVIWILQDRLFNRFHLSAAEQYLQHSPHYFTNINALGKGIVYDQFAWIRGGKRLRKFPRLPIRLNQVTFLSHKQMAGQVSKERKKWPLAFAGDLFFQKLPTIKLQRRKRRSWLQTLSAPYRALFHYLLEKMTD